MIVKSNPLNNSLSGVPILPGDKSISHRSIIIPAIAIGKTIVNNLLESDDIKITMKALIELGVKIEKQNKKIFIYGNGLNSLKKPNKELYFGNSGTSARLLTGLLANQPFLSRITGDKSLIKRPMDRILEPLEKMGATFESKNKYLPIVIKGKEDLSSIKYILPVASAQIKSGILLAGLNTKGSTEIIEEKLSRDHTELMLKAFGANIKINENNGQKSIILTGKKELISSNITVPGDFSSAAFFIVAALLIKGSNITLKNINLNPKRIGLLKALSSMGANIIVKNNKIISGEKNGDIIVTYSKLNGCILNSKIVPSMIDEYPILAIAASHASSPSKFQGLNELRFKESDRLLTIHENLNKCGVNSKIEDDSLIINPLKNFVNSHILIESKKDHRIAMSFIIMGMLSKKGISIKNAEYIDTSFPNFIDTMNSIGANIKL